jgi:hypothetical protein
VPGLCGNGIVNPNETCGEPGLPLCAGGNLCLGCTCRQLGDCQDNGGTPNLFDIIEMIDVLLQRKMPTADQTILCDVDCNTQVNLFDVLRTIDVVLQRIQPPLQCPN